MPIGRLWRVVIVLAVTAIATTCVRSETEPCGDGVCPANTQCLVLVDPALTTCVNDRQLAACQGSTDREPCMVDGNDGTCLGEACFPAECGDFITDLSEACDDGNDVGDDGCSANCLSLEQCGDGRLDVLRGEQCDDGAFGRAGDGCSSRCLDEYDLWRSLTPQTPPSRHHGAFAPDPTGGILLFGGTLGTGIEPWLPPSAGAPLGDTWRWDGVHWNELATPTGAPSPRTRTASAFDPAARRTLIFGGQTDGGPWSDELWEWNGLAWTERVVMDPKPSARSGASLACSPTQTTQCVLFGGDDAMGRRADTWSWNGTSWTLIPVPANGVAPPAHTGQALVYDTARSVFVLIGDNNRPETWELAGQQWTLTDIDSPVTTEPVAAFDSAANRTVVITGTETYFYTGTWLPRTIFSFSHPGLLRAAYDPAFGKVAVTNSVTMGVVHYLTTSWSSQDNLQPAGRGLGLTSAFDPVGGRTIVVNNEDAMTWEWDGATWKHRRQSPGAHPPPRVATALAFDTKCGEAIRFGGSVGVGSPPQNEMWIYKNRTWTPMPASGLWPGARRSHAMSFDSNRGVIVMFGGHSGEATLDDLWEWRGCGITGTWTRITATGPGPGAREGATLVFDEARGVSVLFGGEASGIVNQETWEWNGETSTWMRMTPAVSPPARIDHAMTYDPRRRAIVMVGGRDGALRFADSWQWDGLTWTQIVPVLPLSPARSGMTMSPDSSGGLVLLGGEGLLPLSEIWRLRSETGVEPTELCVLATDDLDGDGLAGCADPDCGGRCGPTCGFSVPCAGPHCGDGTCSVIEDYLMCPGDCPVP